MLEVKIIGERALSWLNSHHKAEVEITGTLDGYFVFKLYRLLLQELRWPAARDNKM